MKEETGKKKATVKRDGEDETAERLRYLSLFSDTQKFQIAMLLFTYRELNVTQISNMLHQSKATISRHLKEMEGVMVEHREAFKEQEIEGRITPKYYRISDAFYRKLRPVGQEYTPGDPEGQRLFYHGFVGLIRSSADVSRECFGLCYPLADYLAARADDPAKASQAFGEYVFKGDFRIDFCMMSEDQYRRFIGHLTELEQKMATLMNEPPADEPQPYFFIGGLFHMGKLLDLQGRVKQERKSKASEEANGPE